jgi:hypothetical protein
VVACCSCLQGLLQRLAVEWPHDAAMPAQVPAAVRHSTAIRICVQTGVT